jgi:hypothetical protein
MNALTCSFVITSPFTSPTSADAASTASTPGRIMAGFPAMTSAAISEVSPIR